MIRCDIEGVSGVVSYEQAEPGKAEYELGRQLLKADLLACVDGLFAGGASEVVIYDEHYYGRNIDPAWLPANVSVICGKPPYRADWAGGLDASFAGVVLLGFHSMFGTPGGLLTHTYELDIRQLRLNGVAVGEIGIEAAIAGDCGVPLVLVTADSAGAAEAEALVPGVRTAVVKDAINDHGARCFPLVETTERIRSLALLSVREPPDAVPYQVASPATLEVELNDGAYLDAFRARNTADMKGANVAVIRGPTATAVWADYWQRKLAAQQ